MAQTLMATGLAAGARLQRGGRRGAAPAPPPASGRHPRRPAADRPRTARRARRATSSSSASASGRSCAAWRRRSSSSSAAPPASARARWPRSWPIASASPASSAPTWCARRCAPSSRPSSCRPSTPRRSTPPRRVRVPVPRETDLSKVGFIEQTKAVSVGIEALVARGIDEAQRMVVEGVHIVPGFLDQSRWREALVLSSCSRCRTRTATAPTSRCASGRAAASARCAATSSTSRRSAASRSTSSRGRTRRAYPWSRTWGWTRPQRSPRHESFTGSTNTALRLRPRSGAAEATDFRRRADTGH